MGDERVRAAESTNLSFALTCALALLPESFSLSRLFTTITSLSYSGELHRSLSITFPPHFALHFALHFTALFFKKKIKFRIP